MKKILFVLFVTLGVPAFSQSFTSLQYTMGFGTGDLGDFIGSTSFRGFNVDFRQLVQPNVGVGVEVGWNVFYEEKANDVYSVGDLSYSGKQYRYSNHLPALFSADYYMKPGEKVNPFAGLGVGTIFTRRNTDMGQYTFQLDAWHFALRTEIGILVEGQPGFSFSVTGKYYYGFEAGDLPSQSYFALSFGFVFSK